MSFIQVAFFFFLMKKRIWVLQNDNINYKVIIGSANIGNDMRSEFLPVIIIPLIYVFFSFNLNSILIIHPVQYSIIIFCAYILINQQVNHHYWLSTMHLKWITIYNKLRLRWFHIVWMCQLYIYPIKLIKVLIKRESQKIEI